MIQHEEAAASRGLNSALNQIRHGQGYSPKFISDKKLGYWYFHNEVPERILLLFYLSPFTELEAVIATIHPLI